MKLLVFRRRRDIFNLLERHSASNELLCSMTSVTCVAHLARRDNKETHPSQQYGGNALYLYSGDIRLVMSFVVFFNLFRECWCRTFKKGYDRVIRDKCLHTSHPISFYSMRYHVQLKKKLCFTKENQSEMYTEFQRRKNFDQLLLRRRKRKLENGM